MFIDSISGSMSEQGNLETNLQYGAMYSYLTSQNSAQNNWICEPHIEWHS